MCGSYHATSCIHVHAHTHSLQNLLEELSVSEALGHAGRPDEILAWSGNFRGKWGGRLENRNKYIGSYPEEGRYAHELNLSEYSRDKVWVILRRRKRS